MLEQQRSQIDEIDNQLTKLFVQRMALSADIAQQKYTQKMHLSDLTREQQLISEQVDQLDDETLAPYVKDWYQDLLLISKQYQAKLIKQWQDQGQ